MLEHGDSALNGGGHKNPPKSTQFPKGRSGNPNGRPKASKNLATLIKQAAFEHIVVTPKSGKPRRLKRIEAGLLQLGIKAAQGDLRAIQNLVDLVDEIEKRAAAARPPEQPISEKDLAVLHEIHARVRACEETETAPSVQEA
ncbi:MAG TPA: DUF5681 domain-containing protein [Rhizomicrobium sp.]